MSSRVCRRCRLLVARIATTLGLIAAAAPASVAGPEVVAVRGVASSIAQQYGPVLPLDPALPGILAAPTGLGVELRDLAQPSVPVVGSFRTAGVVNRVAASGATLFLLAGPRGIVAVDASNPGAPVAVGSIGGLGRVSLGAASGAGVIAAGSDSVVHFLDWDPASGFQLRETVTYSDGRRIGGVAASGDSFLVASTRPGAVQRLILDLYRVPAGSSAPVLVREIAFNGHEARDLAWRGPLAFLADGSQGVLVVHVPSGSIVESASVQGSKSVRSIDVNDSLVVAAAEGRTIARLRRAGAAGDSLIESPVQITALEPMHVRLSGDLAVVSTYDDPGPAPPDEVGRASLEFIVLSGASPPEPAGDTGRARRVVQDGPWAYVADYTGGLRIYRAGGSDSSLVGVLPPIGPGRPVDLALDPARRLVYLASGPAGLEVVDVADPAAPSRIASLPLGGLASSVAVVAGGGMVAVGRRGASGAGVAFVDVADSTLPLPRGGLEAPFVLDPRALAARDTILFVADDQLGVVSIGFGNPDLPAPLGYPSTSPARDLDLTGTILLVATRSRGLQVVDVAVPSAPILRSELATPPALGVARNGPSAALFLGEEGILVVDVSAPAAPRARGPVATPGIARDGSWTGDTLLVAASWSLERFLASPGVTAVPPIQAELDGASGLPRATIRWDPVSMPGVVGLNLYRDLGPATSGVTHPAGRLVNRALLDPASTSAVDDSITAGMEHRYRLEAFRSDGSSRKVAEGTLVVPGAPSAGRAFPNPYRASAGARATLAYRLGAGAAGQTITLRVYSVTGRLVRSIIAPAVGGFGSVSWDGRDRTGRAAPAGVYFLRLDGAGLDESSTITLLR